MPPAIAEATTPSLMTLTPSTLGMIQLAADAVEECTNGRASSSRAHARRLMTVDPFVSCPLRPELGNHPDDDQRRIQCSNWFVNEKSCQARSR
jgi:hypothetical protein